MSQFLGRNMSTPNIYLDIARGRFIGSSALNIFGFNRTVGTSYETIWDDGGNYVYPSSAVTMSVVSSSGSDTLNVLISGLDANYNEITETVTLTGTSPVTTTSEFLRINKAIVLTSLNIGDITISNGGNTYAFIGADIGTTQSSVYTVPAGHSIYLVRIDCTSGTVNGQKYLFIRNILRSSSGRTLKVAESTFSQSISFDRQVPFRIEEKTDFHFEAKSSASDNEVSLFIEAVQIKDS